jgi:hypothetical protein
MLAPLIEVLRRCSTFLDWRTRQRRICRRFGRRRSSLASPGRVPESICACLIHPRDVSRLMPTCCPTFVHAAVMSIMGSASKSSTRRIARYCITSGYFHAGMSANLSWDQRLHQTRTVHHSR